uniref:(northern house mosquito) hypothetical protein n=1 Tax=Culex pipiens TaxID=7175 RepID=A0A8D8DLC0_CULPI
MVFERTFYYPNIRVRFYSDNCKLKSSSRSPVSGVLRGLSSPQRGDVLLGVTLNRAPNARTSVLGQCPLIQCADHHRREDCASACGLGTGCFEQARRVLRESWGNCQEGRGRGEGFFAQPEVFEVSCACP